MDNMRRIFLGLALMAGTVFAQGEEQIAPGVDSSGYLLIGLALSGFGIIGTARQHRKKR